jgi:RNA polymerase sigma factor (sigma-70 family)
MAASSADRFPKHLQTLFTSGAIGGLDDGALLERFVAGREEAAFDVLVARHGPMVFRVCRASLADPDEAEDAFQAVFLVLVRKGTAIRSHASIASWLFGVATRVCARAKFNAARRRKHERQAALRNPATGAKPGDEPLEAAGVLHEELARLPDRYREALILCYFEGHTCDDAAVRLRRPVGTVKARLSRARGIMKRRLLRRGVALPAGLLAVDATAEGATVPTELVNRTVSSASRLAAGAAAAAASAPVLLLTEEVIMAMLTQRIRFAAALALPVVLSASIVLVAWGASGPRDQPPPKVEVMAAQTAVAAPDAGTPEEVFSRAIAALDQDRIEDFVAAMHPEDVKRLRAAFDRSPQEKTEEAQKPIEDRPFVVQFLGEYLGHHRLFKLALAETMGEVLGHVDEGPENVYVVYRSTVDEQGRIQDRIKVVQLRKDGQKWAMQLPESRALFARTMMNAGFQTFAGNNPPAGPVPRVQERRSRFEPVGRLLTPGDTAYAVLRHVSPQGNFLHVLTVRKGDLGWEEASAGKPDGLARLVRMRLYRDPPTYRNPAPRTSPDAIGPAALDPRSPEIALLQAVDLLNQGRLEDFVAAMHPEAVKQLRTAVTETIDARSRQVPPGKLAMLPGLEGLAESNMQADLTRFPGVKSFAELKTLDDRRFVALYLATLFAGFPEFTLRLTGTKIEPLGHVVEGGESVHVVYRSTTAGGRASRDLSVANLRKDGQRWAMEVPEDLATFVESNKQMAHNKLWTLLLLRQKVSGDEPLGRLLDGPDTAHVVYRQVTTFGDSALSNTRILTVRKSDPAWPEALAGKPEGLATLIEVVSHRDASSDREHRAAVQPADWIPAGDPFTALPPAYMDNQPRTKAIQRRFAMPVTLKHSKEVPLERVLSELLKAAQGPNDRGITMYVEPVGLAAAERTMTTPVTIDVEGVPLEKALRRLLGPLKLAYSVLDGLLIIGGRDLVDEAGNTPIVGCDESPRTSAILSKLEQPIALKYPIPTPFEQVVAEIVKATQGPNDSGLRIYVDPYGLDAVEQTMTSPVTIDLEGVPLRTTLRLLLRQLGLTYSVHDGLLIITAPDTGAWEQERTPVVTFDASPQTRVLLTKLAQPVALEYPDETPLERVIADVTNATRGANDPGISIDVDPAGLEAAEETMTSPIRLTGLEGIPLRTTLRLVLDQLGLGYFVENGRLKITDIESLSETWNDRVFKRPVVAFDRSLRTLAVLIKLEQPNGLLSYPEQVPLRQVISDIAKPVRDPNDTDIPVHVDPAGLKAAGRTLSSPILLPDSSASMVPLRVMLRRVLSVMGLDYYVDDGRLIISDEVTVDLKRVAATTAR